MHSHSGKHSNALYTTLLVSLHTVLHCTAHCTSHFTAHCTALHTALHISLHIALYCSTLHTALIYTSHTTALPFTLMHWTAHFKELHCTEHCTTQCITLYCIFVCIMLYNAMLFSECTLAWTSLHLHHVPSHCEQSDKQIASQIVSTSLLSRSPGADGAVTVYFVERSVENHLLWVISITKHLIIMGRCLLKYSEDSHAISYLGQTYICQ